MSTIRRRSKTANSRKGFNEGFKHLLDGVTSLCASTPTEKIMGESTIAHFTIFSIVELQKVYYIFHPKVSSQHSKFLV